MDSTVRSYIVRVYPRRGNGADALVGVVEMIGTHGQQAFRTIEQLWEIIGAASPPRPAAAPDRAGAD